ncbi:MAG: type IV pilus twitching motility protein PilT [Capsulimonadaceae bacterium]|nr:type IV pilus twitching motility protein PilT [Capsulimonadaceae bacterium]
MAGFGQSSQGGGSGAPGAQARPGAPGQPGMQPLGQGMPATPKAASTEPSEERTLMTMLAETGVPVRPVEDLHLDELLHTMVEKNSTDLHIASGMPPCYRVDGALMPMPYEKMTGADTQRMMYDILTDEQIQRFESTWELDFAYALQRKARFRVNIYKDKGTVAAALRLIPTKMPTLSSMGYSPVLEKLTHLKRGLVLVTGPTGSGKSTTLAAMINTINCTRNEHILTIEDPIEYLHTHRLSVINQREVGADTKTFQAALRAALREDPDVILVGEMRDLETMQLAISAAETGHLVFGTLHTNSASSTVDRIVDSFPDGAKPQVRLQLSNNIQAVICQTLVPKAGGPGRVGVQEIMIASPAIRNLIREAKAHQITSIIQTSAAIGMVTMDQGLRDAYLAGKISYDNAIARAQNAEDLKKYLAQGKDEGASGNKNGR